MQERNNEWIPSNIDECIIELDKIRYIDEMFIGDESDVVVNAHFSLGRWIRNSWGLWDDKNKGDLRQYFVDRGVNHPDDMSSIILVSYYRHRREIDLRLDEQINYYVEYYMSDTEKAQHRRRLKLDKLNE